MNTDNALVFEIIFNEEVYDVGSDSFYANIDGVQDKTNLSVRSVHQIDNNRYGFHSIQFR